MGAARGQIARQFLLESLVLGLMGGLAGLGLAYGGVRLLTWMGPESLPRLNEISLDSAVLTFTLGISLLSGLLFGLFPVFRLGGLDLVASLKEGGCGGSVGKERHRARNTLVVAQMALALVLLAGSGLMIRSFQALRNVDPGFANPEEVLTFRVAIPAAEIEDEAEVALAYEDILAPTPGDPWGHVGRWVDLTDHGWCPRRPKSALDRGLSRPRRPAASRQADKDDHGAYFEAMQNPVLAGRPIEWSDIHDRALVVVVTANFCRGALG